MKHPALNVRWPDGRLVGRVISPGATYFAYAPEWLANGFSLSPLSVPFTGSAYRQRARDFDGLPGFLSDCLPDQWGRRLMLQEFSSRGETMTPLRMLAWVGRRGLGALSFEPTFDEGASVRSWEAVSASLLVREAEAVLQARPPEAFARLRRGGTAGGALPKACVALLPDGAILIGGDVAAEAIQRPGSRLGLVKIHVEGRDVTRVSDGRLEHAYMRMCAAAGVRTARTEVLRDDNRGGALHHLFVERFDATADKRLHVVTLAGLLHRYELHYRDLLLVARQLTQDHAEVLEATRRMIFNVRASNQDDHGKNHAFIVDERLQWRLSPAYDVTLNADEQTFSGLSPASFGRSPRLEALRAVAADAGVSGIEFNQIDAEVAAAIARWPEFAAAAEVPRNDVARARSIHEAIAEELSATLPSRPRKRSRRRLWE